MMRRSLALTSLLLSTGLISPIAQSAEYACADRVTGLSEIGVISVDAVPGSPQEVERIIAWKADEHGASYYRIVQMQEVRSSDNWQVQAIIYA